MLPHREVPRVCVPSETHAPGCPVRGKRKFSLLQATTSRVASNGRYGLYLSLYILLDNQSKSCFACKSVLKIMKLCDVTLHAENMF